MEQNKEEYGFYKNKKVMPPCYKCTDRELNCHSVCEKYKEWKTNDLAYKEEIKKANEFKAYRPERFARMRYSEKKKKI